MAAVTSTAYWQDRYIAGGHSGAGSYGKFAEFKAEVLNDFVASRGITSVIEFGCGDGNQLSLAEYPAYLGFDVSEKAIAMCRRKFAGDSTKDFQPLAEYAGDKAELALSLDIVYHLIEDDAFGRHMRVLFAAAQRFVIIYSSNFDESTQHPCVKHRKFTDWIERNAPGWKLLAHIPNRYPWQGDENNGCDADFFIYEPA